MNFRAILPLPSSLPPGQSICRFHGIRCDGKFPCEQCVHASLTCKRDHVPKKRGPKRGHGRVINELRAKESSQKQQQQQQQQQLQQQLQQAQRPFNAENAIESPTDVDIGMSGSDLGEVASQHSSNASAASTPPNFWAAVTSNPAHNNVPEPRGIFSSDELRPRTRHYFNLIPQLVELYYEHIYPIMPLIYMPAVRETISRPNMTPSEKNLIYAMCALTSMHMSGKSIGAPGPTSWEVVGRFFLDETISTRQSYDFLEDLSLSAVISSFYLSTSFFEINQSRKSWYYLREALTNAQDLGLQDDSTYYGLSREETLCRQRVFWILFVTERSFAILRNKPITFKRTPSLPTTRHPYEGPDIHAGFLQLVSSYTPLDESFVTAWNEGSDPRVSATTFLALQNLLSLPPAFLRPRNARGSPSAQQQQFVGSFGAASAGRESGAPEPTDIQKADLLITQQWLRLIVWQSSMRQGLLSWTNPAESGGGVSSGSSVGGGNSMCFSFPLTVARDTASILASLPSKAVEVHGMGIMEKIFEIGTWCVNVLGACESVGFSTAMDFTSGEMGVLGSGRKGASLDPIEFFVRTLSASDNSRAQFAEKLLAAAGENPGSMRTQLSPAMSGMSTIAAAMMGHHGQAPGVMESNSWSQQRGTVVGEVFDDNEENNTSNSRAQQVLAMGNPPMHHPQGMQSMGQSMGLGIDLSSSEMGGGLGGVDMDARSVDLMSPLGLTRSNSDMAAAMGMPGFETAWSPGSASTGPRDGGYSDQGPPQQYGHHREGYPDMANNMMMHEGMRPAGGPIGGPVAGPNSADNSNAMGERQQQQPQPPGQGGNNPYDSSRRDDKEGGYRNGGLVGVW
ncbi:putative sucrose utilization protein SUC1 [Colletotrichum trifolii]|uniref:Putative sucrose utilization protein SUC1 n=1 Tax=Colletotrichum trifolii TaxID=5466 RepID=A0A4R8RTT9_COLTR|nr:putative sucrose utilization protein SUC1 [Colletotrichum trifolii]